MNSTFTVSEDKAVSELKFRKATKDINRIVPRIAAAGFTICILVTVAVKLTLGLDNETTLRCVLIPTPLILGLLWAEPLVKRYIKMKWTMKEKQIQMTDGFYIPAKAFQFWSYSLTDFVEIKGYTVVSLISKEGISKSIVLNCSEPIDNLINYLKEKGVNQARVDNSVRASLRATS